MQEDHNLVLYDSEDEALFASGTYWLVDYLMLHPDGNLGLMSDLGIFLWQTGLRGPANKGYRLFVLDDGDLQVVDREGSILWSRAKGGYNVGLG